MKKVILSFIIFVTSVSFLFPLVISAEQQPKETNIGIAKKYINSTVPELVRTLENLQQEKNVTLQDIQDEIDDFYLRNPVPDVLINDENLSIKEIFPNQYKQLLNDSLGKSDKPLSLNDFILGKKKQRDDNLISFLNVNGIIDVYVSPLGGTFIFEQSVVKETLGQDSDISVYLVPYERTAIHSARGIAYNALGNRMFDLIAEGQWEYNGSNVRNTYADGDWHRYLFGSTLNITPRKLGAVRTLYEGSYMYSEVYSELYVESVLGFRMVGIVMDSSTVEVYIGATPYGGVYSSTN